MTTLNVIIDGQTCEVPVGMSIAAALSLAGNGVTRRSVSGQLRAPSAEWEFVRSAASR